MIEKTNCLHKYDECTQLYCKARMQERKQLPELCRPLPFKEHASSL